MGGRLKMKRTKTKLLSSIAALIVCFAMLIGSTFAWFTDSASTGVNRIQAGNLDIEVSYKNQMETMLQSRMQLLYSRPIYGNQVILSM